LQDVRFNGFLKPSFARSFYQVQDMDETLRQVGELLLGSIPTIVFMVLLYAIYTALVHKPLVKVLAERRSKTEGAVEKARADIAAAEARTAESEQRLREARMIVFKNQEALREQALQARAAALAEVRNKAKAQVEQARDVIEKDKVAAQAGLQAESGNLAAEIIRIVLQPGLTRTPTTGGR
jgi:F-type H+-transporting ATPase subunit b